MKWPVVSGWRRPLADAGAGEVARALLDADEIADLARQAAYLAQPRPRKEVHDHHAGDWPSATLGRGLDFEETRPYCPGDDIRDMDWRVTARLGHPFVKIYREERQPVLHLVVDRGPGMRFGTRRRLKATQAARLATLAAFAAGGRNIAVGASLWEAPDRELPARHGRNGLLELVNAIAAAAPPLPGDRAEAARDDARLLRLNTDLPRGARVLLLSDFAWLRAGHENALAHLAARVDLLAIRIVDAAERALPDVGLARFLDLADGRSHWLDTARPAARQAHAEAFAARGAALAASLARAGVSLLEVDGEIEDLTPVLRGHA